MELNFGRVEGLPPEEQQWLQELKYIYDYHRSANRKKRRYYNGKVTLNEVNLGIALPAGLGKLEIGCAWGAKTVDVLAGRSMFDGFVTENGTKSEDMDQIMKRNHLIAEYNKAVKEELKYKGPIDKFIPDDMKMELAEMAGLQEGDTIFFIAAPEKAACIYAGQIRNELGSRLDLLEKDAYRFCYINDFPMYEIDEETGKLGFTHNPFSMPQGGLEALNEKDPLDILAYQYDIVCNGVELSSGAVRNHDMEIMEKAFDIAGYDKETLKDKFGALYNAFQFGAPPHAGMAPGVDRMIMLLRNEENIREIIAFPMSGTAQDLMCGAPNEITEQQLREVHIKVRD